MRDYMRIILVDERLAMPERWVSAQDDRFRALLQQERCDEDGIERWHWSVGLADAGPGDDYKGQAPTREIACRCIETIAISLVGNDQTIGVIVDANR